MYFQSCEDRNSVCVLIKIVKTISNYSILDETVFEGVCTVAADTCTYPNSKCVAGQCGCEDGLAYNAVQNACCKSQINVLHYYFSVSLFYFILYNLSFLHVSCMSYVIIIGTVPQYQNVSINFIYNTAIFLMYTFR